MKLDLPRLALFACSLALVLLVFVVDWTEKRSPGELSAVHAQRAELEGAGSCELCHGAGGETMADACARCHAPIGEQLAARTGFHGTLEPVLARACARCHSEHHGRELALVNDASFRAAGFDGRVGYDHRGVAFALGGAHEGLACARCHALADAELLREGTHRFLGRSQECASCHDDPHGGRMGSDCASCHGQERPFGELASFVHTARFPLEGAHAIGDCERCHAPESAFSVAAVAGATPPPARGCVACHETPHAERFLAALAERGAGDCARCHPAVAGGFSAPHATLARELHAASGFPLERPHDAVACDACHGGASAGADAAFAARHPGRAADDCASCHGDPHAGEFETGAFAGATCADCHAPDRFHPTSFDLAEHARAAFPLEGSHAAVACDACHVRTDPLRPARFADAPVECASCHADAHAGAFTAWVRAEIEEVARAEAQADSAADCALCHRATRFDDVDRAAFDHGAWTAFALRGAHAELACEACHVSSAIPDASGRRFSRIAADVAAIAAECRSCHADVHGGSFGREELPASVDGRAGCARCHDEGGWSVASIPREPANDLPAGDAPETDCFDHALWTGFALDGAHEAAACIVCHVPRERPDAIGRRFGRVEERFGSRSGRCESCHEDPHGGAFAEHAELLAADPRGSCAACHTTERWELASSAAFDHARWTGFELDGAHARAACTDCHARERGGDGYAFGRARGRECAACHEDPHLGQLAADGSNDCARCHASRDAFATLDFDHARDSRFALDATHARLACGACHKSAELADGRRAVRYKPLGTQCADCHGTGERPREEGRR